MQYLNLNKSLEMEEKILDLLLISIDDQIEIIDDKDGISISGKINVSGTYKSLEGTKDFLEGIDIDVFLTYDELVDRNSLNVSVNDFNYKIEENKLLLEISLKVEGLKEIETNFLAEENTEFISEKEIEKEKDDKEKRVYVDKEIEIENNVEAIVNEEENIKEKEEDIDIKEIEEEISCNKETIKEEKKSNKKSLLKSVFSSKRIKEEVSWRLHCVKDEASYDQIAVKYGVNLNKLISINKNEKLVEGKLIFLPLD